MTKDCIFCKIISKEIPSYKIWENNKYLSILDINPNVEGMTLVITKKHFPSYVADIADEEYSEFFLAAKKVARLLEEKLGIKRVAIVMEGMGINHAHIKLYPMRGLKEKFEETWTEKRVFFEEYPGYITTRMGPEADKRKLERIQKKITEMN